MLVATGTIEIGIGAGVESMSTQYGQGAQNKVDPKILAVPSAADCLIPMGITSENVASDFQVTREKQDKLALASNQKAVKAWESGFYSEEIVPVTTEIITADGKKQTVTVSKDDGMRADVSIPGTSVEP